MLDLCADRVEEKLLRVKHGSAQNDQGRIDHVDDVGNGDSPQAMAAGDCLIFDDRILHRGLANTSQQERWVAYFSYLRPRPGLDEIADTHFEATRSLWHDREQGT